MPADPARALGWYTRAAERGFAPAQYNLAVLHERGAGVPRDIAQAVYWYAEAARRDFAPAATNLALAYLTGAVCRAISRRRCRRWRSPRRPIGRLRLTLPAARVGPGLGESARRAVDQRRGAQPACRGHAAARIGASAAGSRSGRRTASAWAGSPSGCRRRGAEVSVARSRGAAPRPAERLRRGRGAATGARRRVRTADAGGLCRSARALRRYRRRPRTRQPRGDAAWPRRG